MGTLGAVADGGSNEHVHPWLNTWFGYINDCSILLHLSEGQIIERLDMAPIAKIEYFRVLPRVRSLLQALLHITLPA